jgi:hypothetical protein
MFDKMIWQAAICKFVPSCELFIFHTLTVPLHLNFNNTAKKEVLKGTVQRKLTGVLSGINRKLMICHCSDGYSFFNLKGLRSLKSNVFSALTGTLF